MISYADNHSSVNAGAQQLLEDMQRGVGDVISKSICVVCLGSLLGLLLGLFRMMVDVCRWTGEARGLGGEA